MSLLEKPEEEKPGLEMSLLEKSEEMFLLEKPEEMFLLEKPEEVSLLEKPEEEVSLLEKHSADRVKDIPVSTPSQPIPDVSPTEWEVSSLEQVAGDRERSVLEHTQHKS